MTKKIFNEKLKKAIRESGLTQKEIAKIFGVKQAIVSKWLSGHSQLTLDKFEKLLEVLGKDANYFFENTGTISHSGQGDIAINSSIKKSDNSEPNYQHLLERVEKLEKITKNKKKSKH